MSTPAPGTEAERLLEPLRADAARAAICTDLDGTLAPIVERAEDAAIDESVRTLLGGLTRRYAEVVCVSGRRAREARRLIGVGCMSYIGNHGFERFLRGAWDVELDPAVEAHADDAKRFIAGLDRRSLRSVELRIEDKGPIWALHWRGASDEVAAEERADQIAADASEQGFVTHRGRKVLEIRPPVERDKGSALEAFLNERPVAHALYAGDDLTDLDAFRALRELRETGRLETAVCVGVASDDGPDAITEQADLVVEGTAGIVALYRGLSDD